MICFELHLVPMNVICLFAILPRGAGYSTNPTTSTTCNSTGSLDYNITLNAGTVIDGSRSYSFGRVKIAESNGTFLIPEPSYSSRLTPYGTYGISLSNVTTADAGEYTHVYLVFPPGNIFTSTATLSVLVSPHSGCSVSATQVRNKVTCAVHTGSGNCGIPILNAYWVNYTNPSNHFECTIGGTYQCCATSAALTCYTGSRYDFCIQFNCTPTKPDENNTATIVGVVIGGCACVGCAAVGGKLIHNRYKKRNRKNNQTTR